MAKYAEEYLKDLFGEITGFVGKNGKVMFSGNQICKFLEYSKETYTRQITKFVSEEDRELWKMKEISEKEVRKILWSGNDYSDKWMLTEAGMYALIVRSGMPKADPLFFWVTHEVIPSIRENGLYVLGQENMQPDNKDAMIEMLKRRLAQAEADRDFATEMWEKYEGLNKKHSRYLAEAEDELDRLRPKKSPDAVAVCKLEVASSQLDYYVDKRGCVVFYKPGDKYQLGKEEDD